MSAPEHLARQGERLGRRIQKAQGVKSSKSPPSKEPLASSKADSEFLLGRSPGDPTLATYLPERVRAFIGKGDQKAIPALAKNKLMISLVEDALSGIPTLHRLINGDARAMDRLPGESIHLAVTSPPYWILKKYSDHEAQLGAVRDYEAFLNELDKVWTNVFRVLVPGGRLIVVVGDVCRSRKENGRHVVVPLHASIQERCRKIGFDNLAPIIWHKIANAKHEVENGSSFLGKPYEPNGIIKNDIEFILFQRKPGGYRQPSLAARILSTIPEGCHREWFRQIWTLTGAFTRNHPAPFPVALAERLIRMFSFAGDTVLDPFTGTGTTNVAAVKSGRSSMGVEIIPEYFNQAKERLISELRPRLAFGQQADQALG